MEVGTERNHNHFGGLQFKMAKLVKVQTIFVTLNDRVFRCTEFIEEIVKIDSEIVDLTTDDGDNEQIIDLTQDKPELSAGSNTEREQSVKTPPPPTWTPGPASPGI